ncbi:MAG: hypothetical protein ACK4WM_06205 [Thermoflexales bacterium]
MRYHLSRKFALLLACAMLALTGCSSDFRLALPPISVEIDADGYPSVWGIPLRELIPSSRVFDANTVRQLSDADIQHIEASWRPEGVFLWGNGKPLTPIVWDRSAFDNTLRLARRLGAIDEEAVPLVNTAVEILRALQASIIVRLPLKSGVSPIPPRDPGAPLPAAGSSSPTILVVGLRVTFDDNGMPSVDNVSLRDLESLGLSGLNLPRDTIQQLQRAGIQHLTLRTTPEGIRLWVNADPLPTFRWSKEMLDNTAQFVAALPILDPGLREVLRVVLPLANSTDVHIVLRFPTGGAAAIPEP